MYAGSAIAAVDSLATLTENWDGYGASPIDPFILDAAREFLARLVASDLDHSFSPPRVVPMSRGRLQFEWSSGPRELEVEFDGPLCIHYLKWEPSAGFADEGTLVGRTGTAIELVRWCFSRS